MLLPSFAFGDEVFEPGEFRLLLYSRENILALISNGVGRGLRLSLRVRNIPSGPYT